eukprot:1693807-Prymnesium_polylepis.1
MADELTAWLRRCGARWSGVKLTPCDGAARGYAAVSTRAIRKGDTMCLIPKTAILSIRTASAAPLLRDLVRAGCPADAALNLAVAHERALGPDSRWDVYLRSLSPEPVPFLWSAADLKCLQWTGLDASARARRAELTHEHARIVELLLSAASDDAAREGEWAGEPSSRSLDTQTGASGKRACARRGSARESLPADVGAPQAWRRTSRRRRSRRAARSTSTASTAWRSCRSPTSSTTRRRCCRAGWRSRARRCRIRRVVRDEAWRGGAAAAVGGLDADRGLLYRCWGAAVSDAARLFPRHCAHPTCPVVTARRVAVSCSCAGRRAER